MPLLHRTANLQANPVGLAGVSRAVAYAGLVAKPPMPALFTAHKLNILSYNIQAGVYTSRYREYVTQSWKQLLPHRERLQNLDRLAGLLGHYDLVGLQEVDAGSLRSGFIDQTEYLAHHAGFPYWYRQVNRSLGKFAQHSNGFLSRFRPYEIAEHRLPGLPGRGAILVRFGFGNTALTVCIIHVALGRRARARQLGYVGELVAEYPHVILLGDLNCGPEAVELRALKRQGDLVEPVCDCNKKTFPSWQPMRNIDHILVSPTFGVEEVKVLDYPYSDHLPVSVVLTLPETLTLSG